MQTKQVGPYVVRALTVEEGLDLLPLMSEDSMRFQRELITRTVTKDGLTIAKDSFAALVPHFAEIIDAAMLLNGFRGEPEPV